MACLTHGVLALLTFHSSKAPVSPGDVIKYLVKSEPLNLVTEISSYVDLCSSRRGQRYIARVNHPLSGAHSHFYPPPGTIECINRGGEANNDIRGSA